MESKSENEKDFGNDYLEFYPAVNGGDENGMPVDASKVCIDGWFTSAQLRNIAAELERLEIELKSSRAK